MAAAAGSFPHAALKLEAGFPPRPTRQPRESNATWNRDLERCSGSRHGYPRQSAIGPSLNNWSTTLEWILTLGDEAPRVFGSTTELLAAIFHRGA